MGRIASLAALSVVCLTVSLRTQPAETGWPQWRGPTRNGAVSGFVMPDSWPMQLTLRWRVEIGEGYASPVVLGDHVYVHTGHDGNETVTALDTASGELVWEHTYAAPYSLHPAAAHHGTGPKSTPVVGDGRVFTFGISGILSALDAATGALLWRFGPPETGPLYGTAMSPLFDGDRLIAHVGGHNEGALTAFEAATGQVVWRWAGDGPAYASPVVATLGGTRQLVTYTQDRLVGIDLTNGALLWETPFTTISTQNSVTPVVYHDLVLSSGFDKALLALRPVNRDGQWTVEMVWENPEVSFYMSSPVVIGDVLYGLSHRNSGQWVSVDVLTGRTRWTSEGRQAANAALAWSGTLLFALNNAAELFVVETSQPTFDPLRIYEVGDGQTWGHPAFVNGGLLIKADRSVLHWRFP